MDFMDYIPPELGYFQNVGFINRSNFLPSASCPTDWLGYYADWLINYILGIIKKSER